MGPQIFDIFGDDDANTARVVQMIFNATKRQFPISVTRLANNTLYAIQGMWQDKAKDIGGGWGRRYANTIQVEPMRKSGGEGHVFADEKHPDFMFVMMVERGVKSYSISDALMKSKRVKYNEKTGLPYIRVPFRWRTPQQGTGNKAQATSTFAGVMPPSIYEAILSGEKVDLDMAKKAGNPFLAGLVRYKKAKHGQYFTFRTVTKESNWQHQGKPKRPVFHIVRDIVQKALAEGIESYIKKFEEDLHREYE